MRPQDEPYALIETIARRFSALLREHLTAKQMRAAVADPATLEHTDAAALIARAVDEYACADVRLPGENNAPLWELAWEMAAHHRFFDPAFKMPTAEQVARAFRRILARDLQPDQLERVYAGAEPDDVCDANLIMAAALVSCGLSWFGENTFEAVYVTKEDSGLWNAAVDAMRGGFSPNHPEFTDYPWADLPQIPDGWRDTSWHNDSCPSFETPSGLRVFIDYIDITKREIPEAYPRFGVSGQEHSEELLHTDDWGAVLEFVARAEK